MSLTPHFTLEEMTASDTAARLGIDNTPSPAIVVELRKTAELLERVRLMLGTPLLVTSGYRCLALNRAIGSADTSAHLAGRAADFRSSDSGTPFQICKLLAAAAAELDFDQLIWEFGAWVHIGRSAGKPRRQLLTIDGAGTRWGIG